MANANKRTQSLEEMAGNKSRAEEDKPFDVFKEFKWLFFIVGFAPLRNSEYLIYMIFLVGLQLFVQAMASYAMHLVPQKSLIFDALHVIIASWFGVGGLFIRIFANRSIMNITERIQSGIYHYEGEELDDEQIKIKSTIAGEIKWRTNAIIYVYIIGFTSNTVFFPISQYFMFEDKTGEFPEFLNPYISHVFYSPFNTRTIIGYIAIYIIDFYFLLFIYVIAIDLNVLYITCTVYVKVHLQLLNHSIKNIQTRAYLMYKKNYDIDFGQIMEEDLMNKSEFQKCLYRCLKSNIKHHQTLLSFREECSSLVGSILLQIFIIVAVVYASTLYQMYQDLPLNVILNYTLTSLAEQTYTYFIFIFGEELIGESSQIFLNLYSTDWYHYDERFKKSLGIMMVNAKKPLDFKALVMSIPASMEKYGDKLYLAQTMKCKEISSASDNPIFIYQQDAIFILIQSCSYPDYYILKCVPIIVTSKILVVMYKIMSLARQSDKLQ